MTLTRLLTAGLVLGVCGPIAAQSGTGISGSAHDFSAEVWNFRAEICRVCHVPHDHDLAFMRGSVGMLWNHASSTATYTMYTSSSLQGVADPQPTGISKMCLGCHDGTVAIDAFDTNPDVVPGGTFIQDINPNFRVPGGNYWSGGVGDMSSTHPISITYDEVADGQLAPKTDPMGSSGSIGSVLEDGKIQCHSCHDVHNAPGETVPGTHLLRVAQTVSQGGQASGLCLTCHLK